MPGDTVEDAVPFEQCDGLAGPIEPGGGRDTGDTAADDGGVDGSVAIERVVAGPVGCRFPDGFVSPFEGQSGGVHRSSR
ncbi:hypothetical protein [Haloarcula sediminis]|uniref:hypothetical protein n=1 Tax=Haloarcula sediminis TaxID=3111777 RepID=UPI002D78A01D|nr:hypothetical protein [Haloarcula sp. CK38]